MFKFLENPKVKLAFSAITYILGSTAMYFAIYLAFVFRSHNGRGMLTFLPTVVIYFFPICLFLVMFAYFNAYNVKTKWRTLFYGSIVFGTISIIMTIWHLVVTITTFHFTLYGNVTHMFPFDTLVYGLIACAAWIYIFITCLHNKELNLVPKTIDKKKETLSNGAMVAYLGFSAYFTGAFFFFSVLAGDGKTDSDIIFISIVRLAYLLPLVGIILYSISRFKQNNVYKYVKISTIAYFSTVLAFIIFIVASIFIDPYWVPHSISGLFPVGYAIKLPIGLFVLAAMLIISFIVCMVKLAKLKKYEQK